MPKADIKIYADILDPGAASQAYAIAEHPCIDGPVRIMPDAHSGAGCVIGFTGSFGSGVIPNVVGVDIGCGVAALRYDMPVSELLSALSRKYGTEDEQEIFKLLDSDIRTVVPTGPRSRSALPEFLRNDAEVRSLLREATEILEEISPHKHINPALQVGTLGGGNHFLEIDRFSGDQGFYLTVHSGSRNLGHKIGTFFQTQAKKLNDLLKKSPSALSRDEAGLRELFSFVSPDVARGLEYLPYMGISSEAYRRFPCFTAEKYLYCARAAQKYAALNRRAILRAAADIFPPSCRPVTICDQGIIESVHNYIDDDGIVRKGAISARAGEKVIIPLSMKDGVVLGTGKGNPDWNFSAPHGAGRIAGRAEMKRRLESGELSMDDFRGDMAGVFTSSVTENTIDESSFAYKPAEAILEAITPAVRIDEVLKPLFNLKDTEPEQGWNRKRKKKEESVTADPERE